MVMKKWMICLACFGSIGLAAEPVVLPLDLGTFKTLDNKVYEEAKVIGSDAVGIKIMHAGGTARIIYDRLPRDLAAKFEVKPEAAKEQLEKEAAAAAAHEREMKVVEKPVPTTKKPETSDEKLARLAAGDEDVSVWDIEMAPEATANTPASGRIAALEAYVARARNKIAAMEKEVVRLETSAARSQVKVGSPTNDPTNNQDRADFRRGRVSKQQEKIAEVHRQMKAAEREIEKLR